MTAFDLTAAARIGLAGKDCPGRVHIPGVRHGFSAWVFGMPKQAIRLGAAESVLPLGKIAGAIMDKAAEGGRFPNG